MKIQYASDLHLEIGKNKKRFTNNPLLPIGDVLILAGDIMAFSELDTHQEFIDYCSHHFKMVYWVPGNHEYFNFDLEKKTGILCESIRSNFLLVNNTSAEFEGVRLIFSTLWSRITSNQEKEIAKRLSDFRFIKSGESLLTIERYNQLYNESIVFLEEAISEPFKGSQIIVTHHVPTLLNYPKKYLKTGVHEAFATELETFIQEFSDKGVNCPYWIYAHHHHNVPDFTVGNTKLITNQYVKGFDRGKVLEI